ncbi:PREDICTED: uncharacterized protein LOC107071317 isoform X1 [Polistes dominula]|uniref:Uncharacterized protein LOC107071317 isoform X1 n=2 Tax=Polistes dominula TaxID=743375 RepID=A0ABM1IZR1_POLDO|nr:PREDICTED: uncharacterized protein LOC107071317 isoform X1 [Polistes dominula]
MLYLLTAGDGCFYIGMGGKSAKPKIPSYEPYQCCPAKVARGTKLAKATKVSSVIKEKDRLHGNVKSRFGKMETSALKPINKLTAKESRKMATTSSTIKSTASTTEVKQSQSKAKRGFFGTGASRILHRV